MQPKRTGVPPCRTAGRLAGWAAGLVEDESAVRAGKGKDESCVKCGGFFDFFLLLGGKKIILLIMRVQCRVCRVFGAAGWINLYQAAWRKR